MALDSDFLEDSDCTYSQALLSLLTTNDPPQPPDKVIVQTEIARGQQQLEALDKEISRLQETLYSLQERRGRVKKFVDDHICILSPFRSACLPAEIITEIFYYVAGANRVTCNVGQGIWNLGRVCRYWRNITLSSPSLWSHMSIDRTAVLPITQELVARSRGAPLNIGFTDKDLDDAQKPKFQEALSALMPVSQHWHFVTIDLHSTHHLVFSSIKGRLPLLKSLRFSRAPHSTFDCFSEAPKLEQVTIGTNVAQGRSLAALQLPWTQLRECSLPSSWPLDHLNVLKQCPNIETMTLSGSIARDASHPQPSPGDMVRMPKLTTLRLAWDNKALDYFILPSLQTVTVKQYSVWDVHSATRLKDCLERSSRHLKWLKLRHSGLLPQARRATEILQTVPLPHLTGLVLVCDITSPSEVIDLFSALTIPTDSANTGIILPRLKQLCVALLPSSPKMKQIDSIKSNLAALVVLAQSRCQSRTAGAATNRLTYLQVDWEMKGVLPALAGALEPLVALRDTGLVLNVANFFLSPVVDGSVNTPAS